MSTPVTVQIPLTGFLNTRANPQQIADGEFVNLSYWEPQARGGLRSRWGRVVPQTYATPPGGASYLKEVLVGTVTAPTRYLVTGHASSGRVQTSSNLTTSSLLFTWPTTQIAMQVDVLKGSAWFVNGVDPPQQWTGASATTVVSTVSAMPVARLILMYKNYCFVARTAANPSRVFVSAIRDPETWPTNNELDVSPNDGDEVTALHGTSEGLLIFKQRSVWMWLGDTFLTPFDGTRLIRLSGSEAIGTVAPESVRTVEGVGVMFLGRDGFYAWTGTGFRRMSDSVNGESFRGVVGMTRLVATATGYISAAYPYRREAWATVYRNRYWVTVEGETFAVTGDSRELWMYDVARDGWTMSLYEDAEDGNTRRSLYPIITFNNVLLGAKNSIGLSPAGGTPGLYEMDVMGDTTASGTRDVVGPTGTTKVYDLGTPNQLKHVTRMTILYGIDNALGVGTLNVSFIGRGGPEAGPSPIVGTFTAANGTQAATVLGSAEILYRRTVEINAQARSFWFTISASYAGITGSAANINRGLSIYGLFLDYTLEPFSGSSA